MSQARFDLSGKNAIVTGGSRGIGAAIALALAEHGARVVVSSRKLEACQTLADRIKAAGGEAIAIACHGGDTNQITQMIEQSCDAFGSLDILVNNSAANPWFGPLTKLDMATYDKTVDVNLRGTLFASIEAARRMRKTGGGSIINIGSVNADQPVIGQGIYSITKGAIATMTRSLAKELGPDRIRVNAIEPGITKTDALRDLFGKSDELPKAMRLSVPLRRHAIPDEMAGAAVFLASDAASYVTGTSIRIDGGLTL